MITPERRAELRNRADRTNAGYHVFKAYEMREVLDALDLAEARERRLREALQFFAKNEKSIMSDVHSAHSNRGAGASEWMREDDADMRKELREGFASARALLAWIEGKTDE